MSNSIYASSPLRGKRFRGNAWRFHSPSLVNGFRIVSHKYCNTCAQFLPLEDFYQHRTRRHLNNECISCTKEGVKKRRMERIAAGYYECPKRLRAQSNQSYLRRYGITVDQRDALVAQGCVICGTRKGRLEIDHDHRTGIVRGALCRRHNSGVGMFNDDPVALWRTAAYVARGAGNVSESMFRCARVSLEETLTGGLIERP